MIFNADCIDFIWKKSKMKKVIRKEKELTKENVTSAQWSILSLAWELGYLISLPLVIAVVIGYLADRRLGTSPWLTLAGVFISVPVAVYAVYQKTSAVIENESKLKEKKKK